MLQRAADKLGGVNPLASYLGIAPVSVRVWMRGFISPPDEIFLRLVDLLQESPPPPRPDAAATKGKAS
jgi:hypothetical protein